MKQIGTVVVVILWWFDLKILIQSVPITTKVVSSNAAHGDVYLIPVSSYFSFRVWILVMVFNATFNNMSAILWRSVLLGENWST
jgi:hypothetical protein